MLQVQNLQKTFGIATILDGISFVLNDGEHLGLIGPNGSGKSTLLRCVAGLEPRDRGSITLRPTNLSVGYLPQAFGAGDDRTIGQVTESIAEAWRARMVLEGLGLGGIESGLPVQQLSGGQKTRVGLATLLLGEPDVLLLDEPTNHLDVDALAWLEGFINDYPSSVLVV